jgi:tRNA U55 pseudouridine synthase TruB
LDLSSNYKDQKRITDAKINYIRVLKSNLGRGLCMHAHRSTLARLETKPAENHHYPWFSTEMLNDFIKHITITLGGSNGKRYIF